MGAKKVEAKAMMTYRERAVCSTLCMCLACAVLSAVALVYLTVIIYLPAQRELESGIGETSVMCTTIEKRNIADDIAACRWSSCSEWCLSKGGGACTHIYVNVRSNGSDIELEGCTDLVDKTCSSLEERKYNCKEDHQCTRLDKLFKCEHGVCTNITSAYACKWDETRAEPPVNCAKKRNCVELEGQYNCVQGWCSRVGQWKCERRCVDIPTSGKNALFMVGDRMVMANCQRAINFRSGETIWSSDDHPDRALLASCTTIDTMINKIRSLSSAPEEVVSATDCVNGTLLPTSILEKLNNHSVLINAIHKYGPYYKLDTKGLGWIPYEEDITIFNRSRLMINHEGCVNTLQGECTKFYDATQNDGRNDTSRSRFPCYYAASNPAFVVLRYDPFQTRWLFFIGFLVPASLLIVSCGVLFTCSRILSIDNAGRMKMENCCKTAGSSGSGTGARTGNFFQRAFGKNEAANIGRRGDAPVAQIQLTTSGTLLGYNDEIEGDPL